MPSPDDRQPMNTAEVAAYLRVSEAQVRQWVNERKLGCSKLGPKVWRFRQSDIDAFMADQSKPAGHITPLDGGLTTEERSFFSPSATASRTTKKPRKSA